MMGNLKQLATENGPSQMIASQKLDRIS